MTDYEQILIGKKESFVVKNLFSRHGKQSLASIRINGTNKYLAGMTLEQSNSSQTFMVIICTGQTKSFIQISLVQVYKVQKAPSNNKKQAVELKTTNSKKKKV